MPVAELDARAALVVVDLQKGTVVNPMVHPIAEVIARTIELAAAFRHRQLPVVFATVRGVRAARTDYGVYSPDLPAGWSDLTVELAPQPTDVLVSRAAGWSAFNGPDLHERLGELGVTQIVLTGIATSFGVESTARQGYDLGYNVVLALDAMTDLSLESHENALARVFPALGETGTTAEIIAVLDRAA